MIDHQQQPFFFSAGFLPLSLLEGTSTGIKLYIHTNTFPIVCFLQKLKQSFKMPPLLLSDSLHL